MSREQTDRGTDATFWKDLTLWLSFFAVLALIVGGVVGIGLLGVGRAPPAMDDLHVSNADDANHTVRVEVIAANGSSTSGSSTTNPTVFERTVYLVPNERVSFDGTTAHGRAYRLVVTIDDREPESFDVEGSDDLCTIEIEVEPDGTAGVGESCA